MLKLLSIDTASNICGVSILEDTTMLCHLDLDTGRTHSENLMPMIEEAFSKTSLSLGDIDLIVCDIGPGSFTGIRIGVATTKAFSDSRNIPSIGISSLETLAYSVPEEGLIASLIDCKHDDCYFALYEHKDGEYREKIVPCAENISTIFTLLPSDASITFVGDGAEIYQEQIRESFSTAKFATSHVLDSYFLALAGLSHFYSHDFTDVLPLYLKKPLAQKQLEEKEKNLQNH